MVKNSLGFGFGGHVLDVPALPSWAPLHFQIQYMAETHSMVRLFLRHQI